MADKMAERISPDELKRANEKLLLEVLRSNAVEDQLNEVAEFRERLIGMIGHDLRNPLNAVLMASGLLATHDLGDKDRELVLRILGSGRRMKRILGVLIEFTRARLGGGFELHVAPTDLGKMCEQLAGELRLGASATVDVRVRGDVVGSWDEARIGEAISNLASNAVDHAHPNTTVVVDVHAADGDVVEVEVTNEGDPIPQEQVATLFEAFKSATAPDHKEGHLGLGLFIASEVVRAHGGTLDARCDGGKTTFTMRLPRASTSPELSHMSA